MITLQNEVLAHACSLSPKLGFTEKMLHRACKKANISLSAIPILFPHGAVDVVTHIKQCANKHALSRIRERYDREDPNSKFLPKYTASSQECVDIVTLGMVERLRYIYPYAEHWSTAMGLNSKHAKLLSTFEFALFVDELIFHATGKIDQCFVKQNIQRCSLGAISLMTEMHLIRDTSQSRFKTEELLCNLIKQLFG